VKVPPGFNQLVEERAQALWQFLGRHVLPVFRLDELGDPTFEGSCVAVGARGRSYVVSAAHVLDATASGGIHLLLQGREQSPLQGDTYVTLTQRPPSRSDDLADVGYVELTQDEVLAIGPDNFLQVPDERTSMPERWYQRLLLVGYPGNRQVRDDCKQAFYLTQTRFASPNAPTGHRRSARLDDRHFAMRFDQRRITSPRGRGGRPNFKGMSGGGVWLFDPYASYSEINYPSFLGFLVGSSPLNKKILFGTSWTVFTSMLDDRR
jgi:hypothetical protein